MEIYKNIGDNDIEAPEKMTMSNEEDIKEMQEALRKNIASYCSIKRWHASDGSVDVDVWDNLCRDGWIDALLLEKYGGQGLGLRAGAALAQVIGEYPVRIPFVVFALEINTLIGQLEKKKVDIVNERKNKQAPIGVAWQEGVWINNLWEEMETVVKKCGDGPYPYRMDGRKDWVTAATFADGWVVGAIYENRPSLWLVLKEKVRKIIDAQAIDHGNCGSLILENVSLCEDDKLAVGDAAIDMLEKVISSGTIGYAAELIGLSEAAMKMTVKYTKDRVQFERPLATNQAVRHKLADVYILIEEAKSVLDSSCMLFDEQKLRKENIRELKIAANDAAQEAIRAAVQLHGAIGYTREYELSMFVERAMFLVNYYGGSVELRRERVCDGGVLEDDISLEYSEETTNIPRYMTEKQLRYAFTGILKEIYPESMRYMRRRLHWNEARPIHRELNRRGWLAPAWPTKYGGMELPAEKLITYLEVLEEYGVGRMPDLGIIYVGPILMKYGTEGQKKKYMPRILSGEDMWCQGYSEPNAGSDLASLTTKAEMRGDKLIINGSKIWTSYAHEANKIFMLVRTKNTKIKQEGISFVLADMSSPGITTRTIETLDGEEDFCQVFFTDVEIPIDDVVGTINTGWTVAKSLLGYERLFAGSPTYVMRAMRIMKKMSRNLKGKGKEKMDAEYREFQARLGRLKILYQEFARKIQKGENVENRISILKVLSSELYTEVARTIYEYGGTRSLVREENEEIGVDVATWLPTVHSLRTTIYGGANEIQKDIIAKRCLDIKV